jgi:hypothetical protein
MAAIALTLDMIKGGPIEPEKDFQVHAETVRQALAELPVMLEATSV